MMKLLSVGRQLLTQSRHWRQQQWLIDQLNQLNSRDGLVTSTWKTDDKHRPRINVAAAVVISQSLDYRNTIRPMLCHENVLLSIVGLYACSFSNSWSPV